MPAEARVLKMWSQQKGLVPLLFLAFAAWFLWDGLVGYPRSDERYRAHKNLSQAEWEKLCAQKGWKTDPPEKEYGPAKYREQFWVSGITAAVGLTALAYWQTQRKTVIRNDDSGISTSRGLRIPYASITQVDTRIWKEKGYAYVHYSDGQGKAGKFTLDDAKHAPKALDVILEETIAHLPSSATVLRKDDTPSPAPPRA
jgi:hypothetical protein